MFSAYVEPASDPGTANDVKLYKLAFTPDGAWIMTETMIAKQHRRSTSKPSTGEWQS